MNIFHQTTEMSPVELDRAISNAQTQQDVVIVLFKAFGPMTASECHAKYEFWTNKKRVPLTSIRRALSNLVYSNWLIKSNQTKTGIYGAKEHVYQKRPMQ